MMNTIQRGLKYSGGLCVTLSVLLLSACGGSSHSSTTAPEDDAITETAPTDEADDVPTTVKLIAVFNNELKIETIDDTSLALQGESAPTIVGTPHNPDTLSAALEPDSDLTDSIVYTAAITTAVEDVADDPFSKTLAGRLRQGVGEIPPHRR